MNIYVLIFSPLTGQCPSHVAVDKGRMDMLTSLLDMGCDVNAQDGKGGQGVLTLAAERGHADMVELLLSRGAHVNSQVRRTSIH